MDEQEVIQEQIEETRSALTEKLETLEKAVTDTVLSTAESVESVTNAVQETVESVKDGVQETVSAVTDSVKDSVQAMRDALNVPEHVNQHPVLMFTGAVVAGYCMGRYLSAGAAATKPREPARPASLREQIAGNGRHGGSGKHRPAEPSKLSGLLSEFSPEINKLRGLALGALMGVVRDVVVESLPANFKDPVKEIFTSVTEKIGGTEVQPSERTQPSSREFASSRM